MKPIFISYSAATGAALIGASRPRGIEYGREIRCYEDQHPDQKRHHVYESERESRSEDACDGRKRDFGPFHLKKWVPVHPSGAPDLSSAKPCLLRCSR